MFNFQNQLNSLRNLADYALTEHQFAYLIGSHRMYPYLKERKRRREPAIFSFDIAHRKLMRIRCPFRVKVLVSFADWKGGEIVGWNNYG